MSMDGVAGGTPGVSYAVAIHQTQIQRYEKLAKKYVEFGSNSQNGRWGEAVGIEVAMVLIQAVGG